MEKAAGEKVPRDKVGRVGTRVDRATREAAALRANLVKRKDQARLREDAKGTSDR